MPGWSLSLILPLAGLALAAPPEGDVFPEKLVQDAALLEEHWGTWRHEQTDYTKLVDKEIFRKQALTARERRELEETGARLDKTRARLDAMEPAFVKDFSQAMDQAFNLSSCSRLLRTVDPRRVRDTGGKLIGGSGEAFGSFMKVAKSADTACALVTQRMIGVFLRERNAGEKFSETLRRGGRCDVYSKSFYEWINLASGSLANLMACIEFPIHSSRAEARLRPLPNGYILDGYLVLRNGPSPDSPPDRPSLCEIFVLDPEGRAVYLANSFDEDRLVERVRNGEFDYLKEP